MKLKIYFWLKYNVFKFKPWEAPRGILKLIRRLLIGKWHNCSYCKEIKFNTSTFGGVISKCSDCHLQSLIIDAART